MLPNHENEGYNIVNRIEIEKNIKKLKKVQLHSYKMSPQKLSFKILLKNGSFFAGNTGNKASCFRRIANKLFRKFKKMTAVKYWRFLDINSNYGKKLGAKLISILQKIPLLIVLVVLKLFLLAGNLDVQ